MVYSPSMHLIHWSRRSFTIFHVDCFLRQWNFFSPDSNNISKCKVYFKLEKRTVLICSHVRTDCLLGVLTPAWRNNDRCFDKIRSARVHNTQLAHMYMHWRDKVTGKDWNYISFVSVLGGRTTQAYLRTAFCKKKTQQYEQICIILQSTRMTISSKGDGHNLPKLSTHLTNNASLN